MLPDLDELLLNPTGWEEDIYGIIHPAIQGPVIQINGDAEGRTPTSTFTSRYDCSFGEVVGLEVRDDGEVFISEGGVRRQAEGWERIGLLRDLREAFGGLVNIEPE